MTTKKFITSVKVLVNDHFRNALLPREPGVVFYVHKNLISSGILHDPRLRAQDIGR